MKKSTFFVIIAILVILVVALFPYNIEKIGDSGSKKYKSLVYEITIYNEKIGDSSFYKQGYTINVLGNELANSTSEGEHKVV